MGDTAGRVMQSLNHKQTNRIEEADLSCWNKKQLENMVAEFKEQKPDVAGNVDIEVLPLEGVIETLATTEDKMWEKIVLVPSAESIQFLQNNAPASGTEGATPAPAATPEAAPAE